jgi:photosystem II stability/assembly factor-like uncharacterized protein
MRTALAIIMLTFTLGLASRPIHGETRAEITAVLNELHMIDRQNGWAMTDRSYESICGTVKCLLRTTAGGTHWTDVTPLGGAGDKIRGETFTALSSLIAWVATAPNGDPSTQIFRTIDGGRSWKSVAIPSARAISFINPREGWVLTMGSWHPPHGYDQAILHSTNGGETWTQVSGFSSSDSGIEATKFLNPTTGWLAGETVQGNRLILYVTHDGGRSWQQQEMPLPRELTPPSGRSFPQPPSFFTVRDGILPVFYERRNDSSPTGIDIVFYVTHDGGTTWTHAASVSVPYEPISYAVADVNHAWVKHGSTMGVTSDGGRRWTMMPPSPLLADVTQLEFISPEVGWAVRNTRVGVNAPMPPFLLKTLDSGRTWSPVIYTISGW